MTSPKKTGGTDAEFIQLLKNGDEMAWAQLCRDYALPLYKYISIQIQITEDVEDILSQVFSSAVKVIPQFDDRVTIKTFLYSLANRKMADFWHKKKLSLPESSLVELISGGIEFHPAMEQFPEQSRYALLLRYQKGLSVAEVAEVLDRTFKGTESLLRRARKQLESIMGETVQSNYFAELLISRYPKMNQAAIPLVQAVKDQQHKCESQSSGAEAAIFQKCAVQLIGLSEVAQFAELWFEE